MFLLSDMRADSPPRRGSRTWNALLGGALLVGFALLCGQSLLAGRSEDTFHSINVGRHILGDPFGITITPVPDDAHTLTFSLTPDGRIGAPH